MTAAARAALPSGQARAGPAAIADLVLAQKILPDKAAIDVPLALAIAGLAILIVLGPSLVPGLTPPI